MKNLILSLILLFLTVNLVAQKKIVFSDFNIVITDVVKTKRSQLVRKGAISNSAESFFIQYFFPKNLIEYKKLYKEKEVFDMTPDDFENWQKTLASKKIYSDHIVYFTCQDREYAALPYAVDYDSYLHRHVKLAKLWNGRWYPLTKEQNMEKAEVKSLLMKIKSTYLEQVVRNSSKEEYFELLGQQQDSEFSFKQILETRQKDYLNPDYSSSRSNQQPFQSSIELTNTGLRKFDKQIKPELVHWLLSKNINSSQIKKIVHLFYRGEQLEAIVMIDELEDDDQVTVNDYIKELKVIFKSFK